MKARLRLFHSHPSAGLLASLLLAGSLAAAPTPPKKAAPAQAPAATEAAEPEVPQSVFLIPSGPREGRDPFFPNSTHAYSTPSVVPRPKPNQPVSLVVNGISTDFVILNGRTFARGETAEVPMGNHRVRVTCIEIKADSVIVEVGGERRELRPKTGLK